LPRMVIFSRSFIVVLIVRVPMLQAGIPAKDSLSEF
jgi:hypothetical protein